MADNHDKPVPMVADITPCAVCKFYPCKCEEKVMADEEKKDDKAIDMPDDHKIIDPDPKAEEKKQWLATTGLRMKKFIKGMPTPQGIQMVPVMLLQQLFQNQETAELEWRSVPIVDEQNKRVEMN